MKLRWRVMQKLQTSLRKYERPIDRRMQSELFARAPAAIIGSVGLSLLLYFVGALYRDHFWSFATVEVLILLSNLARYWAVRANKGSTSSEKPVAEFWILSGASVVSGFAWGLMCLMVVCLYGETSLQHHLVQILLAGVAQSAVTSLGAAPRLCRAYLALALIPTGISLTALSFMRPEMVIGVVYLLYYLFLNKQAKLQFQLLAHWVAAENKLEIERNLFKTTLDTIPGPVSFISNDLRYIFVNKALTRMLGIGAHEILGKPTGFLNSKEKWAEEVTNFISGPERKLSRQMEIPFKNEKRWHAISMNKANGPVKGAVFVGIDIHSEKMMEEGAKFSAKMAEIGALAAGMTHEISNPLSVILGKAQLLRMELQKASGNSGKIDSELERIEHQAARIQKIIRSFKALSRKDSNDPMEPSHLDAIIQDAVEVQSQRLKEHDVRMEISSQPGYVIDCRASEICQVLTNLIGNACDAVAELAERWVKVEVREDGTMLCLRVMDSGTGIPEEIAKKLMQPFFTTKAAGRGTGLGLSISRRIAEQHGGELIIVRECPNTCFELRLPIRSGGIQAPESVAA